MLILFWSIIGLMILIALSSFGYFIKAGRTSASLSFFLGLIFIPVFSLLIYFSLGASHKLQQWFYVQQDQAFFEQIVTELNEPEPPIPSILAKIKSRLEMYPDSVLGWYFTGQLLFNLQAFDASVMAYERAYQLEPDEPSILSEYIQALFMESSGKITPRLNTLLDRLLAIDPNNDTVLTLLAMNAFKNKNYQQAINYWEKLLEIYPSDSPSREMILGSIERAAILLNDGEVSK